MYKALIKIFLILLFATKLFATQKPTLLFYCGITMVKPIKEIAKIIEKKHNCNIKISQGGSKDLYKSLKYSKVGDMYLPGSDSYRKDNLKDGFLLEAKYIGFNKAAIFVRKGNPKNIKNLNSLVNEDIASIIVNPKSGSVGKHAKKVIIKYKNEEFFENAFDMAVLIGTDSRNINSALIENKVDMAINWRATAFWDENKKYIDIIEIDSKYAPKKKLGINLLSFSKNKEISKSFMDYAASKEGQIIMKKYGFLN